MKYYDFMVNIKYMKKFKNGKLFKFLTVYLLIDHNV